MKLLLENWRQFIDEQTEFQFKVRAKHPRLKHRLIATGDNKETGGGEGITQASTKRSKSAPAGFGAVGEAQEVDPVIVIFGPTGSGKSTYKKHFIEKGYREVKTHTTRPPRGPEDDEYVFYDEWPGDDKFINTNYYQGHHYGTDPEDFAKPGKAVMLSDIDHVEELKNYGAGGESEGEGVGKKIILLHAKSWTEDPGEMEAAMSQRDTPERLDVWRQETKSTREVEGSYPVTSIEQAEAAVQEELMV